MREGSINAYYTETVVLLYLIFSPQNTHLYALLVHLGHLQFDQLTNQEQRTCLTNTDRQHVWSLVTQIVRKTNISRSTEQYIIIPTANRGKTFYADRLQNNSFHFVNKTYFHEPPIEWITYYAFCQLNNK